MVGFLATMRRGACLAAVLGVLCPAHASAIRFTHEGRASGMLDGVEFPDSGFVIEALGDTADRKLLYQEGFFIDHLSASISIEGLGVFEFVTPTRTFVNNTIDYVGFSRAGLKGADLFDGPKHIAFETWDMLGSIGPHSGEGQVVQWLLDDVVTSGGVLVLNDVHPLATFTAVVVPEPAAMALLGIAVAAGRRRR